MTGRLARVAPALAMVAAVATSPVAAQEPPEDGRHEARAARRAARLLSRGGYPVVPRATTAVIGAVWSADNEAVPQCGVRLRDLMSGGIAARTVADDGGEFAFDGLTAGTYLVEVTGSADGDDLIAVGELLVIAAGQTVATFVKLPPPLAWYQNVAAVLGGANVAGSGAQGAVGAAGSVSGGIGGIGSGLVSGFSGVGAGVVGGAAGAGVGGFVSNPITAGR